MKCVPAKSILTHCNWRLPLPVACLHLREDKPGQVAAQERCTAEAAAALGVVLEGRERCLVAMGCLVRFAMLKTEHSIQELERAGCLASHA